MREHEQIFGQAPSQRDGELVADRVAHGQHGTVQFTHQGRGDGRELGLVLPLVFLVLIGGRFRPRVRFLNAKVAVGLQAQPRRVSATVAATDQQADSVTHFNRRRAGFRSSIKAGTSTVSRDPSAFSSTSCDARPWPEKWTRSHPSPSLRIVLRASRVTPYWSTRKSIARPAVRAIERIVSLSVYRSCRRFRAPAPVGKLKTASIRSRLTVGSLSRSVAPAGRTSTMRLTSCSAGLAAHVGQLQRQILEAVGERLVGRQLDPDGDRGALLDDRRPDLPQHVLTGPRPDLPEQLGRRVRPATRVGMLPDIAVEVGERLGPPIGRVKGDLVVCEQGAPVVLQPPEPVPGVLDLVGDEHEGRHGGSRSWRRPFENGLIRPRRIKSSHEYTARPPWETR